MLLSHLSLCYPLFAMFSDILIGRTHRDQIKRHNEVKGLPRLLTIGIKKQHKSRKLIMTSGIVLQSGECKTQARSRVGNNLDLEDILCRSLVEYHHACSKNSIYCAFERWDPMVWFPWSMIVVIMIATPPWTHGSNDEIKCQNGVLVFSCVYGF